MSDVAMTADDLLRKRRAKNIAVGLAIAAVCVLFFVITIVRMGKL